jgi:hydroxyacylglutathione hydrolase
MKRALKVVGGIVVVLVIALGLVWFTAFGHNSPIIDGQIVVPGVVVVKDSFVSSFLVDVGPGKVALVDAGNDTEGKPILAALAKRGLGKEAVVAIFLTHGHGDHTAGCKQFPEATVYAMAAEADTIGDAAKVGHPLHDGDAVDVGELHVEAFAVPGHTPGSAVFLARGVLFFGDSAGASKDGVMTKAVGLFSKSSGENVASLKTLETRLAARASDVKMLAFAHTGTLIGFGPLTTFAASN